MALTSSWILAATSAGFWLLASLLVGLLANRLPPRWLQDHASPQPWPRGAASAGIHRWKRWIPDAGPALPGGIAKAQLVERDPASLQRLLIETRRAELVHWLLWAAAPLTALWLPPAAALVNLLFATAANLPCVLLQRFNRQRVRRCLSRAQTRPQATQ